LFKEFVNNIARYQLFTGVLKDRYRQYPYKFPVFSLIIREIAQRQVRAGLRTPAAAQTDASD